MPFFRVQHADHDKSYFTPVPVFTGPVELFGIYAVIMHPDLPPGAAQGQEVFLHIGRHGGDNLDGRVVKYIPAQKKSPKSVTT